jgi:methionine sulfoxide reductase heme-binding subunit
MAKAINSWRLFWLLALATSIAICLGLPRTDFNSARGMEFIILRSVRCALPCFIVAFTASSLAILWPGRWSRWLLSNRRYFGVAFAFGMGWHLSFVAYSTFRFGNQLNATVTTFDLIALLFLIAMTLTSFRRIARRLSLADWQRLHKAGAYLIWLLATDIYLANVRGGGDPVHDAGLAVLLAAWMLRAAAWVKTRLARGGETGAARASPRDSIKSKI